MNKLILVVIVVVVVIGAIILVGGKKSNNAEPTQITVTAVPTPQSQGEKEMQKEAVTLTPSGFEPQIVTVNVGTKVVFTNKSGDVATVNSAIHPTHLIYPPLNLDEFADGKMVELVFDKQGTYKYHDHLNPTRTGTVVVE